MQAWVQHWVQTSSPHTPLGGALGLSYVVVRGPSRLPYYKRRVPAQLREVLGRSTFTAPLTGAPGSKEFKRAYDLIHGQAEAALAGAEALPKLSAQEQLGVAGRWAAMAPPQSEDTGFDAKEVEAVLMALDRLGIVLPSPMPAIWKAPPLKSLDLVDVVREMARTIQRIPHPAFWHQSGEVLYSDNLTSSQALAHLEETVGQCRQGIGIWIKEARKQLKALGLMVAAAEVQAVALRLVTAAVHLGQQAAAIEAGKLPDPLPAFPPPPNGKGASGAGVCPTFDHALDRWARLRRPAHKSQLDAAARLQELANHTGHDRLTQLTPAEVTGWRDALLEGSTASTAKRKLAMVRAVLGAAAGDGLELQGGVLERLASRGLRDSSGTRRERRPFSEAEAAVLWQISRHQEGRPLDRWGFPLGLALGARLEELAGLRREDVHQADGLWVVEIQPSTDRRLKNDSSARVIPLPDALVAEGFVEWSQQQGPGLLFLEPKPPAVDPRLSHYASIRLGKLLRGQAGIADRAAVFHSSRHFTAQQLVDSGAEQRVIEQILGHTSRSMTARYSRGGVPLALIKEAMERRSWGWISPLAGNSSSR